MVRPTKEQSDHVALKQIRLSQRTLDLVLSHKLANETFDSCIFRLLNSTLSSTITPRIKPKLLRLDDDIIITETDLEHPKIKREYKEFQKEVSRLVRRRR